MANKARQRTPAVTILSIVLALIPAALGILALLDMARYMGWLPISTLGGMKFVLPQPQWFNAIMAGFLCMMWFAAAGAIVAAGLFWSRRKQNRRSDKSS